MKMGLRIIPIGARRLRIAAVAGAVLALTLAWIYLPAVGLRWELIRTLRDFGMIDVTVADTSLSLFDGHLVVRDMVAHPPAGTALGIDDFTLRFRWAPLLHRRLVIDRMGLSGGTIELAHDPDHGTLILNGLPLIVAPQPDSPDSPGWGIEVAELDLRDSRLHFTSGAFTADLIVDHLTIANLHSTRSDLPVRFRLEGRLNQAAVILEGTVEPFAPQPSFAVTGSIGGLALDTAAAGLRQFGLDDVAGQLGLTVSAQGVLGQDGPEISGSGQVTLAHPSLRSPLGLTAKAMTLDLPKIDWNGGRVTAAATLSATALDLKDQDRAFSAANLSLDLAEAGWENGSLTATGRLRLDKGVIRASHTAVSADQLSLDLAKAGWNGKTAEGQGKLEAGRIDFSQPDLSIRSDRLAVELRKGRWDGNGFDGSGSLTAMGLDYGDADLTLAAHTLGWSGTMAVRPDSADTTRLSGRIALERSRLSSDDVVITLEQARTAQAAIVVADTTRLSSPAITVSSISVIKGKQKAKPETLSARALDLGGVERTASGHLRVARVGIETLTAWQQAEPGRRHPWGVEAQSMVVTHLAVTPGGMVGMADNQILGMTLRLLRTQEGLTGFAPASNGDEPPPALAIGRLSVGGNSRVLFEDRSQGETVRIDARPVDLTMLNLDTTHPNRDSAFDLLAVIGSSRINAKGLARPFGNDLSGEVEAGFQSLELPPLSPYLSSALGASIRTGHFDGTISGAARDGRLSGTIQMVLSNLFVAQPDPASPLARSSALPIETMLDLLRDDQDRIRLSIPVGGQINAPDFDLSDAVGQAVAGALQTTVLTTLKYAFPLTALMALVADDDDLPAHLALAPLVFDPGESSLTDSHRQTLDRAAALLRSRASLHLTLCGKATISDWPALAARKQAREQSLIGRLIGRTSATGDDPPDPVLLAKLADRRSAAVAAYLADSAGIVPGRLYGCRSEYDQKPDATPRVDLLL